MIPYRIREKSIVFERVWNWKHVIRNREQNVARLPSYFRYAALEACYFFWTGSKPGVLFQRFNWFSIFNQQHSFTRLFDFNIFYIMQIMTFSKFLWFRNWKQLSPTEFISNFLLSLELFLIPNAFCYVIISLLVWFSWFCRPSFLHANIFRTIGHIQISGFSSFTCLFRLLTFQVKTYATRWLRRSGKVYIHTTYYKINLKIEIYMCIYRSLPFSFLLTLRYCVTFLRLPKNDIVTQLAYNCNVF